MFTYVCQNFTRSLIFIFYQAIIHFWFALKCFSSFKIAFDLVQPKKSTFLHKLSFECTSKLRINFLNQFSSIFSHLNSSQHILVIALGCALGIFLKIERLFSKATRSFVAIELLTFSKNAKFHFYCSRELSVF